MCPMYATANAPPWLKFVAPLVEGRHFNYFVPAKRSVALNAGFARLGCIGVWNLYHWRNNLSPEDRLLCTCILTYTTSINRHLRCRNNNLPKTRTQQDPLGHDARPPPAAPGEAGTIRRDEETAHPDVNLTTRKRESRLKPGLKTKSGQQRAHLQHYRIANTSTLLSTIR